MGSLSTELLMNVVVIVEDGTSVAEHLRQAVSRYYTPVVVTAGATLEVLAGRPTPQVLIIPLSIPNEDRGLSVLRTAREAGWRGSALLLAPAGVSVEPNLAFDLRATVIDEPIADERVEEFLRRMAPLDWRLRSAIADWVTRYRLSVAEQEILLRCANGEGRALIAQERNCSELTLKKHISNVLNKVAAESLAEVLVRLLREAGGDKEMYSKRSIEDHVR